MAVAALAVPALAALAACGTVTHYGSSGGVPGPGAQSPPPSGTALSYRCKTGWAPLGSTGTQPFNAGPEPSWGAQAPVDSGDNYEYPAVEYAITNSTSQPVTLGNVSIIYYGPGGAEINSGSSSAAAGEVLAGHQSFTFEDAANNEPTGATSCQVIPSQG